ncbi:TraM recognition domain-containing protein [Patescibacteria group bacterium]|nr:TraM recognition domain-containing protein [Patescibacteria group bacterium]
MKIFDLIFHPYFVFFLLAFLLVALAYYVWRFRGNAILKKSLDFSVFEVILPRIEKQKTESVKTFKDIVAVMEQFYSGMAGVKPYFVLELVSPAAENETNFYAAVPREFISFFEKQVLSVFPAAEIREEKGDYNIFKYKSPSAGAIAGLKASAVLPVVTYEALASDPMEVLANVFSSLERDKEGAALQIIIDPGENNFKNNIERSIKLLQSGESAEVALKGGKSLLESLFTVLTGGLIHEKPADFQQPSLPREEIVKLLNQKISKRVARANIRLITSAPTKERARQILEEMKSVFSQFDNPQGNAFVLRDIGEAGLKKLFFNFSFRIFDESSALYLNFAELTSLFHFPVFGMSAPRLKFVKSKKAEAPANLPQKGLLLGKNYFRNTATDVYFSENDRRRHFYIVGQTGTGKSVLIKNMLLQDIKAGHGVCYIDPHGSDIEEILGQIPENRWDDVVYFNPADIRRPFGLNMLEYDPKYPEQKTFIVNELLEIFNKLYDMSVAGGPMFEQYFRNAALLVMEDPGSGNTLLEISRVLSDAGFRKHKLSKATNPIVKNFWIEMAEKAGGEAALQNIVPYITSKFDTFLANEIMRPIVAQEKSSFNFREIMDGQKILLVNLSKGRLGELNANLLGMILVGKLFMAAMSRVDLPENQRKDFYFYIDEFQNITTKSIAMILSEARKYRLSLVIAHQFIGQIEEEIKKAVFGNVGSLAAFRVGEEDAEFLAKYFEPVFSREDLMNAANYNAFLKLLINGETARPFNIETVSPEESFSETAEKVKEISAIKYGRPLSKVESEISRRYLSSLGGEDSAQLKR